MARLNLIDSHAHMDDASYDADRAAVFAEIETNLEGMINASIDTATSRQSIAYAERYSFVYAAIGWHPEEINRMTDADLEILQDLAKHPKVVAIGEIGLDYYHDEGCPHEMQQQRFIEQLELARVAQLPIIIHDREAHGDTMAILKEHGKDIIGVFHCYSGSWEMAKELLKMGFYLGFGGSSTFKNAKKVQEVLTRVPLDRILFETDSPYLTPMPYRGQRNKPTLTELVVEHTTLLRPESKEELMAASTANVYRLFPKMRN